MSSAAKVSSRAFRSAGSLKSAIMNELSLLEFVYFAVPAEIMLFSDLGSDASGVSTSSAVLLMDTPQAARPTRATIPTTYNFKRRKRCILDLRGAATVGNFKVQSSRREFVPNQHRPF